MKALVYSTNPLGWVACNCLKHLWPGCLLSRLNGLSLRQLPPPPLAEHLSEWVRCRTVLGGICGSDLSVLLQRQPPDTILQSCSTLPAVMGHENVAVVEQVGPGADPAWLGKRVCADPALSCGPRGIDPPCRACAEGQYGSCENFSADGAGSSRLPPAACLGFCGPLGGSWGEMFLAHVSQLFEVPPGLSDKQALLTDPLACSLHAVKRADLSAAEKILVCGAGTLGLGVVWALRATGYPGQIDISARYGHQGELARRLGASEVLALPAGKRKRFALIAGRTGGRVRPARLGNYMLSGGYDVVFECVGTPRAIEEALKWTRSRGQTVLVGTGHGRGADLTSLWFGELTVIGASGRADEDHRGRKVHTYRLVHELLRGPGPDVSAMLTHTFPLERYHEALDAARRKGVHRSIKVAFAFPGSAAGAGRR